MTERDIKGTQKYTALISHQDYSLYDIKGGKYKANLLFIIIISHSRHTERTFHEDLAL